MAFLEENCILDVLTDDILKECHPFVCGDDDMDEFFQKDAAKTRVNPCNPCLKYIYDTLS